MTSRSKHFMIMGMTVTVVVVAGRRRLLRDQDDGGDFEARRDNTLAQRDVEDVHEEICELLSKVIDTGHTVHVFYRCTRMIYISICISIALN